MGTLLITLIVLVCILLALAILIQNPKGGGLASGFSSVNQFGGVKRTTDFLEKSTWTLVVVLMALSIVSAAVLQPNVLPEEQATDGTLEELMEAEPINTPQPAQPAPAPAPAQDAPLFDDEEGDQ